MGKRKKAGAVGSVAISNACDTQLRVITEMEVTGPAVLPPHAAEHWDVAKLCGTKCTMALRGNPDLGLFTVSGLLSASECASWIAFGEAQGFEEVGHPQGGGYAHRDNGRIVIDDADVAGA